MFFFGSKTRKTWSAECAGIRRQSALIIPPALKARNDPSVPRTEAAMRDASSPRSVYALPAESTRRLTMPSASMGIPLGAGSAVTIPVPLKGMTRRAFGLVASMEDGVNSTSIPTMMPLKPDGTWSRSVLGLKKNLSPPRWG